jgi:phosphoribosylformimino-5-aminoimidazole carboxamide ribotide isomerase
MIVLDLAGVGEDAGVRALDVCRRAAKMANTRGTPLQLVSGGGVRGIDDLAALADAGCSAALVASALHDGRIAAADVAELSA